MPIILCYRNAPRNRSISLKSRVENHFPFLRSDRAPASLNKLFTRGVLPQDMTLALTQRQTESPQRLERVLSRGCLRQSRRASRIIEINVGNSVDRMDRVTRGSFGCFLLPSFSFSNLIHEWGRQRTYKEVDPV